MAAYPTITVNANAVSITTNSPNLTYTQLVSTLNYSVYQVNNLYLQANNIEQVSQIYNVQHLQPNGQVITNPLTPFVNPQQFQPVLNLNLPEHLVIDNLTTIQFTILPNSSIEMTFDTDVIAIPDYLNGNINTSLFGEGEKEPELNCDSYCEVKQEKYWFPLLLVILSTIIVIYSSTGENKN